MTSHDSTVSPTLWLLQENTSVQDPQLTSIDRVRKSCSTINISQLLECYRDFDLETPCALQNWVAKPSIVFFEGSIHQIAWGRNENATNIACCRMWPCPNLAWGHRKEGAANASKANIWKAELQNYMYNIYIYIVAKVQTMNQNLLMLLNKELFSMLFFGLCKVCFPR